MQFRMIERDLGPYLYSEKPDGFALDRHVIRRAIDAGASGQKRRCSLGNRPRP